MENSGDVFNVSDNTTESHGNCIRHREYSIDHFVFVIGTAIITVVGTSGNTITCLVLSQKAYRQNVMAKALRYLSVLDTLIIWTIVMGDFVHGVSLFNIDQVSEEFCVFRMYYKLLMISLDNWLLVIITLTRLIHLKCPFSAGAICSRLNYYLLLLTMHLSVAGTHAYAIFVVVQPDLGHGNGQTCRDVVRDHHSHEIFNLNPINASVNFLVPCALLLIFNLMITRGLRELEMQEKELHSAAITTRPRINLPPAPPLPERLVSTTEQGAANSPEQIKPSLIAVRRTSTWSEAISDYFINNRSQNALQHLTDQPLETRVYERSTCKQLDRHLSLSPQQKSQYSPEIFPILDSKTLETHSKDLSGSFLQIDSSSLKLYTLEQSPKRIAQRYRHKLQTSAETSLIGDTLSSRHRIQTVVVGLAATEGHEYSLLAPAPLAAGDSSDQPGPRTSSYASAPPQQLDFNHNNDLPSAQVELPFRDGQGRHVRQALGNLLARSRSKLANNAGTLQPNRRQSRAVSSRRSGRRSTTVSIMSYEATPSLKSRLSGATWMRRMSEALFQPIEVDSSPIDSACDSARSEEEMVEDGNHKRSGHENRKDESVVIASVISAPKDGGSSRVQSLTTMLLIASSVFILLNLPFWIYHLLTHTGVIDRDTIGCDHHLLAHAIVVILRYANHSVNFFFYCASGSRFRQEFFNMLHRWRSKCRCK